MTKHRKHLIRDAIRMMRNHRPQSRKGIALWPVCIAQLQLDAGFRVTSR